MKKSDWNLNKRLKSFYFAFRGIANLFSEPNACIHAFVAIIVLLCGWYFELTKSEWCAVILCIGGVFMAEAFNTSFEKLCDKVSPEKNHLIAQAKDLAAGAVLIFVIAAVSVGLIIFLPKFITFFLALCD